ncbi:MAG: enoyl-CoA hydratase-related protein, partial [Burkholderiales bacterium]
MRRSRRPHSGCFECSLSVADRHRRVVLTVSTTSAYVLRPLIFKHSLKAHCSAYAMANKHMTQRVLTGIDNDGNATVMLNRPEVHNAFDPEMVQALTSAFEKLGRDSKVRAVVL